MLSLLLYAGRRGCGGCAQWASRCLFSSHVPGHGALTNGRAAQLAELSGWRPGALTEANERCLITEPCIAAACPGRATTNAARGRGAADRAPLTEHLRLVVGVEVAGRWVRSTSWAEALGGAPAYANALEACQARDAIRSLGVGGHLVVGEVSAMSILDSNRGELRHGRGS